MCLNKEEIFISLLFDRFQKKKSEMSWKKNQTIIQAKIGVWCDFNANVNVSLCSFKGEKEGSDEGAMWRLTTVNSIYYQSSCFVLLDPCPLFWHSTKGEWTRGGGRKTEKENKRLRQTDRQLIFFFLSSLVTCLISSKGLWTWFSITFV